MELEINMGVLKVDFLGSPVVAFIKGGEELKALVHIDQFPTAWKKMGKRVQFWLDHEPYGKALRSEIGYAVLY